MTRGCETGPFVDSGEDFEDRRSYLREVAEKVGAVSVATMASAHYTDSASGEAQFAFTD